MNEQKVTINLPDIGEGVVDGEIIEWLKQEGDPVAQDEPVVIVMTDKATVELPSPHVGTMGKHYFNVGQIAKVHGPLYDVVVSDVAENKVSSTKKAVSTVSPVVKKNPCFVEEGKVLAAPPVRKLAKEMEIDLSRVKGTGPDGRITRDDLRSNVLGQTAMHYPHFEGDEIVPVTGIRRLMVDSMSQSKQHVANFSYFEQVDAARFVKLKQKLAEQGIEESESVTYMPLFIRALSILLHKYPEFNSNYDEQNHTLIKHHEQHIGVAIRSKLGLIVPVLHNVEKMNLRELIHAYNTLIKNASEGKLRSEEMKGATFTITNFGSLGGGGRWATPVIHYPEVGILGVAKIQPGPIVKNGDVVVTEILNLSWSFDHRVIDGEMAAKFSNEYAELIKNPAPLL